jgi:hypothetical protein
MMRRTIWWTTITLIMAGLGVALAIGLNGLRDNTLELATARGEIAALSDAVNQANNRLSAQGSVPVAVPPVTTDTGKVPGPQGPIGPQGVDGFTGAQGIPGVAGAPGLPGVTGDPGAGGKSGADGLAGVTGSAGVPGTNGVTGLDGVAGVAGPAGAPGALGVAGRGVASVACVDAPVTVPPIVPASSWVITYTDATTTTTPGPCRVPVH